MITSVPPALTDLSVALYYYFTARFYHHDQIDKKNMFLIVCAQIASLIPFWWRFWQCINKYWLGGIKSQLINAGKYFSKLLPPLYLLSRLGVNSNKVGGFNFGYWLVLQIIATVYCAAWDYYMDWGLFRSFQPGTYALRSQLKYPRSFYYFAMVLNIILRFYWVIGIYTFEFQKDNELYVN